MPPKAVNQQAWTLRFKNYRTTVLLLVQATQSFESIRQELLSSIRATGTGSIGGASLPSDASGIILGAPKDKNDPEQGWVDIGTKGETDDGKSKVKSSVLNGSPMDAGLKDGALLAFRFADEQDDWDVIMPSYDDEEPVPTQAQL